MKYSCKLGFTLIEIIVTLIIVGVLSVVSFPYLTGFMENGNANNIQSNLLALYVAEVNSKNSTNSYVLSMNAGLVSGLGVSVPYNSNLLYQCTGVAGGFKCEAIVYNTNNSEKYRFVLDSTIPINLTGSFTIAGRNPQCVLSNGATGPCPQ